METTRFQMAVEEAASLVIQAASFAQQGQIFILDMGEPIRTADLADKMIRLKGLEPGRDIKITFTGIRPGERLHEILFASHEETSEIGIPGIVAAKPARPTLESIRTWVATLEKGLAGNERAAIYTVLRDAVPEFRGEAA